MDIHFVEHKKIKQNDITLCFFNQDDQDQYNSTYVDLIHGSPIVSVDKYYDRWFIIDNSGIEYKIKKSSVLNKDGETPTLCVNGCYHISVFASNKIFTLFKKNNDIDKDVECNGYFIETYLSHVQIINKTVNIPTIIWNVRSILDQLYAAILIINDVVVGKIDCQILDQSEIEDYIRDKYIMYPNMNLYISRVDIHPDYQGNHLCKPLVSYMIKHLRRLGYEMMFIENASIIRGGVPACFCYYKAGIDNNYKMRYKAKDNTFKKMNNDHCTNGLRKHDNIYYYISDNVLQRAKDKVKRAIKS
jgi:hypothetical protein